MNIIFGLVHIALKGGGINFYMKYGDASVFSQNPQERVGGWVNFWAKACLIYNSHLKDT